MTEASAEIRLPTHDLGADLAFFTGALGLRLDRIWPADDPVVAVLSGHGLRLRLDRGASEAPGTICILTDDPDGFAGGARLLVAPNGTRVEIGPADPPPVLPPSQHEFVVRRLADGAPWVVGRAGMQYRDLIPGRLGGSIIASHIRIPAGGPVPDMVHFHTVGFQLIFCLRGWVDLVYEDQGPPFRLLAGNCVIQPPRIRHRVLFSSDNLEVVEIGVPAVHMTTIDHDMLLPNGPAVPGRAWDGQRFVHHRAEGAAWLPARIPGLEARDTTIAENTGDFAGVQVMRPVAGGAGAAVWLRHDADILFTYVMAGSLVLEGEGQPAATLAPGDAFVVPPGMAVRYSTFSADLELLEVSLPGGFATVAA